MFDLWEEIANIWQIANISPMMDFFHKILLSEEVSNKMNIFGFIFEKKKSNFIQKSQNIFSSV